jgi:cytochrome c oxidase cbb3-type subunit 3
MYSRFLPSAVPVCAALLLPIFVALSGCERGVASTGSTPASEVGPMHVAVSALFPGGGSPPPPDPTGLEYEGNADAINEGHRLFDWYNCAGCHFHGAGGIGPAFLSPATTYGDRIDQLYASIYQGRPNGMPSWAGKIPAGEIWKIAAYVKSLKVIGASMPEPTNPPPAVAGPDTLETEPAKNPAGGS